MNENEKNLDSLGENPPSDNTPKENSAPQETPDSNSLTDAEGVDTKAFTWSYADSESANNSAPESEAVSAETDSHTDNADMEIPTAESESDSTDEVVQEDTDGVGGGDDFTDKIKVGGNTSVPSKRPRALIAACITSGCAIILLIAFALSLMVGLFPVNGKDVIFVGISNAGQTKPETEASSELLEDFLNSVVIVYGKNTTSSSTGTGVIFSEDGYIITNHHVIEDTDSVSVYLYGRKKAVPATVIGFKEEDDVAVIKINESGLRAATFAKSSDVRYGEKVYAIGTPEGSEFGWSITQGIVSSPERQLMMYDSEGILEKKMNVVQTDAPVNHGNSGGPIINVRGEVVGIVTLRLPNSVGMGFALPSSGVLKNVTSIIEFGHADNIDSGISKSRPLIGITGVGVAKDTWYKNVVSAAGTSIEKVDEAYAKLHPDTTFYAAITGVYVSATNPDLNAAQYIQINDIITEINGIPVTNIYEVMDIINQYDGGDSVSVKYYRNGVYNTVDVILGNE